MEAGLVFFVRGTWLSSHTDAPLRPTASVFIGERIAPGPQPNSGDQISISLFDGTPVTIRCTQSDSCDPPYVVPDTRPRSLSLFERLGRVLQRLNASDIERILTPAVRGAGPQDAVVLRQADGKLDLTPVLAAVDPGRYEVELQAWTDAGPAGDRYHLRAVVQGAGGVLSMGDPSAFGPYELGLIDWTGALVGQAVILVAGPADFERLAQGFARARTMTLSWTQSAGAASVRRLLQYYLLALSRDPGIAVETP
jgi:hypothetical protein